MDAPFWFIVKQGIMHVLDPNGYDHVLYVMLLALPFIFKDWKKVLLLVSLFTIGHTLSLFLAAYNYVLIEGRVVELLIPITIFITAVFNIISFKTEKQHGIKVLATSAIVFGLIHGLGFARYFKMLEALSESKLKVLLGFALGIELAQVVIVLIVLAIAYIAQTYFKVSKRDWVLVISAIIIGLTLPMIIGAEFWTK